MAVDVNKLIFQPQGAFRVWHERECFTGNEEGPFQVPNLKDIIFTDNDGIKFVSDVNTTTGITQWDPYSVTGVPISNPTDHEQDIENALLIFGNGNSDPRPDSNVYLDTSVWPYYMAIDPTVASRNPSATYYRLFYGTDCTKATGEVLTRVYDTNGGVISDMLGFRVLEDTPYRVPSEGHLSRKLRDGDLVTMVIYSSTNMVLKRVPMVVDITDAIRRVEASIQGIVDIRLESSYLSDGDPYELEIPMGMSMSSLGLRAIVTIRDEAPLVLPIDDEKISLIGGDDFLTTAPSQHAMVLSYRMDPGEVNDTSYNETSTGYLTIPYTARVVDVVDADATKLYVTPYWDTTTGAFKLRTWLHNAAFDMQFEVTDITTIDAFDGALYDVEQSMFLQVNLSDISIGFPDRTDTFSVHVTLHDPAETPTIPWTVRYVLGQDPAFEFDTFVEAAVGDVSGYSYDIALGHTELHAWLQTVYWPSMPQFNSTVTTSAPVPNMMRVHIDDEPHVIPVANFQNLITAERSLADNDIVVVEFYRVLNETELLLATVGLPIR